jgi:hypothetical protein
MKKLLLAASVAVLSMTGAIANAATTTPQTFTQGLSTTDWEVTPSFAQFNAHLGTLTGVEIIVDAYSQISAALLNTGTKLATNVVATSTSIVNFTVGSVSDSVDASLTSHLNPATGIAHGVTASTGVITTYATAYDQTFTSGLSSWIGTGAISTDIYTTSGFGVIGRNTSNLVATLTNSSSATIELIYHYTAAVTPVPEASEIAMLMFGLPMIAGVARRQKRA